ncbi:MAG: sulfatase [Gemmatimonadaceae bacterium]|nr:sulfatase [Gemmatimonadaceae bacterium]
MRRFTLLARRWSLRLAALGLQAGLLACGSAAGAPLPGDGVPSQAGATAARPNIVFILSDDEDVALHAYMPKTKALLHDRGTTFDNYFVTYSLCCPSRATTLRGQYPHSTGIEGNQLPTGGWQKFHALGRDSSTIATWLKDAGYRTAMFGKYMNGYQPKAGMPPGWAEWYVTGAGYGGYNYTLNENGTMVPYGRQPGDFLVDVIAHKAADVIRRSAADKTPVFLYVAPFTPHGPSTAAPRHAGLYADAALPRSPAFDEEDVSDKPKAVSSRPRLAPQVISRLEDAYRRRVRSLQSVDDLVDSVVTALRVTGQLENSYIVYASDNGFHLGEHRLMQGKNTPYESDIRVPMVIRGPRVAAGRHESALVLNNDLAQTFAAMAGVRPPSFVEGRSMLPLLTRSDPAWRRAAFMVERRGGRDAQEELGDSPDGRGQGSFDAIRTADHTYVEYGTGERELYDLRRDPHQLENLAARADQALVKRLSSWLAALAKCSGSECQRAEEAPPR